MRLRGRVEGKRIVPYYSRAEIARGAAPVAGKELVWVDDPIEAFFLQVQGSGRVQLANGETLRVGYADQNGHPFQSIGRFLVDRGELKLGETSMQSIKTWAAANPQRVEDLLDQNPSFVFFRELPLADPASGPIGASGCRSLPGDRSPWTRVTFPRRAGVPRDHFPGKRDAPESARARAGLGGAIRNPVRADFFWGSGAEAGALAGRMRQQGRMWVLLPKGMKPP